MKDWISVNDELPEETQAYGSYTDDVLCTNGVSVFIGFLARTPNYPPTWYHREQPNVHVTHWMPLPKIPKTKTIIGELYEHV